MTRGRSRDERGSLTVELVVVTPVLIAMALTVIVFGRVSEAHQQVIEASRAAAEAAAVEPSAAARNRVQRTSRWSADSRAPTPVSTPWFPQTSVISILAAMSV